MPTGYFLISSIVILSLMRCEVTNKKLEEQRIADLSSLFRIILVVFLFLINKKNMLEVGR